MRPSWVEINLEALRQNVANIKELVQPAQFCAVVKADGYGHGAVPVAKAALEAGGDQLAVAMVEEGEELREAGVEAPILLLSQPTLDDIDEAKKFDLIPTVYRPGIAEVWANRGGKKVQLKVDTGMHRVGMDINSIFWLARRVGSGMRLELTGVWSHLAVADQDPDFTHQQLERFQSLLDKLEEAGIDPGTRHLANTTAALRYPETRFDMVRVGLGMYGLHPSPATRDLVELKPVMSVHSQVSHTRYLPAGARPSYDRKKALGSGGTVATVPVGYADGLPYALGDQGEVLIGNRRRPLVGSVTMDMVIAEMGEDPCRQGQQVMLLGEQGTETITAEEWADKAGTINYEIVTRIGKRLPRLYLEGDEPTWPWE